MNKIKAIKIKNEDGSLSEESYFIATEAKNIDMINGQNVQNVIGSIDVTQDGSIAVQLKQKINIEDIVDNLNSTDKMKVLSALQGKVLNDKINTFNTSIETIDNGIRELNSMLLLDKEDLQAEKIIRQDMDEHLQTQINNLANGTPLVANSINDMIDTTRLYVLTTDGYWYYYDNSQWVQGLPYQSSVLSQNSITYSKLKNAKITKYGNLIEQNEDTKNWKIDNINQNGVNDSNFNTTDFIELDSTHKYKYGENQGVVNYYNSSKTWIGFQSITTTNFTYLTPVDNSKYVRISYFNNQYNDPVLIDEDYYTGVITAQVASIDYPIYELNNIYMTDEQIVDYSIGKNKLDNELQELLRLNFELSPYGNLFDSNYIFKDIHFDTVNTTPFKQTGYFITPYIKCQSEHLYQRFTTGGYCIQYYDEDYEVIQTDYFSSNVSFVTPSNAEYWRISGSIADLMDKTSPKYLQIVDKDYYTLTGANQIIYPKYQTNELYVKTDSNILENKSAIFFGDSWTAGNSSASGSWCTWIKNKIPSMDIKNAGRFGATWSQGYNYWFEDATHYAEIDRDYDYVVIEAFTNGLYETTPYKTLGTIDEFTFYNSINDIKNTLPDTLARDVEIFFNYVLNRWAGKKICLIFPYKAVSMMQENNSFRLFRNEVIKCANKYNIPIMDNFNGSNIPTFTQEQIDTYFWNGGSGTTGDGVHLNSTGLELVANKIMSFMKTL